MKMPIWVVVGAAVVIVALALWGYDRFVNPQRVIDPDATQGIRFPEVRGSNLAGETYELPGDLEAEYALVMIAFKQEQQFEINTWIPIARELAKRYKGLAYYEFPTIDRLNPAARSFIDGGMRAGIPDPIARATTITLYLDKPAFRQVLDIPDEEQIVVMVINRQGVVFWRTDGPATPDAVGDLEAKLASLLK